MGRDIHGSYEMRDGAISNIINKDEFIDKFKKLDREMKERRGKIISERMVMV